MRRGLLLVVGAALAGAARLPVETLTPSGGLPAAIAGRFRTPAAYIELTRGDQVVLDADTRAVYEIDRARTKATRLPGIEDAVGLSAGPADSFAVADAPRGIDRLQFFYRDGTRIGGYLLPARAVPRLAVNGIAQNGIGAFQFLGQRALVNTPDDGSLVTELDVDGHPARRVGALRAVPGADSRDLTLGLNLGIPLADAAGGLYFVFQTGEPIFRRYDAKGALVFERHIEGAELDAAIQQLPTTWPPRQGRELPVVPATVRAATVDARGHLWIALVVPVAYEYDETGDKVRVVRFRDPAELMATSLFAAPGGRLLVTPDCVEFSVGSPRR